MRCKLVLAKGLAMKRSAHHRLKAWRFFQQTATPQEFVGRGAYGDLSTGESGGAFQLSTRRVRGCHDTRRDSCQGAMLKPILGRVLTASRTT